MKQPLTLYVIFLFAFASHAEERAIEHQVYELNNPHMVGWLDLRKVSEHYDYYTAQIQTIINRTLHSCHITLFGKRIDDTIYMKASYIEKTSRGLEEVYHCNVKLQFVQNNKIKVSYPFDIVGDTRPSKCNGFCGFNAHFDETYQLTQ